jgi:pimeloyl-ACP methyl ester carboxylesterase
LTPNGVRVAFDLPGGQMTGWRWGDMSRAPDLVFLHANGFNARAYSSLLAPLGEQLSILAVDQRGHGHSTLPTRTAGRNSWHDLAGDLVALLDLLDAPPLILAGHSMGGTVSTLATQHRPDRVKRLALFDPVIIPPMMRLMLRLPWIAAKRNTMAQGAMRRRRSFASRDAAVESFEGRGAFRTWPRAALVDYIEDGMRDTPEGDVTLSCAPEWEASNFASQQHNSTGALKRVTCPVHILRAEHASTCRIDAPITPNMVVETVPGTTHFVPFEKPERVRQVLLEG